MAIPADHDALDLLAEDFAARVRGGEDPDIDDYVRRHPQWASELHDVLSGVLLMEKLKPQRRDESYTQAMPERVGEFRIVREIARGGMGVVYEAEQESLGRHVAVKILPAQLLSSDKLRRRFRREAQAAAKLHHTNIVPVFGVGEADGQCFYVMQLIRGQGLDAILRRTSASHETPHDAAAPTLPAKPGSKSTRTPEPAPGDWSSLPPKEYARAVARIGVQVAEALAYAHDQGVLHRDIKPANLIFDTRETVWVTDFGVAKLLEDASLTHTGDLLGTMRYMPPERFSGRSDALGDVYSLGVTLYELLSFQSAFPDTTPQHLIKLISEQGLPKLGKRNRQVPGDLETIVMTAVARDPNDRYPSAAGLAEDLRRYLEDRPIRARRTNVAIQAWRWAKRNPALSGAMSLAAALMVAITIISAAASVKSSAARKTTEQAKKEVDAALVEKDKALGQAEAALNNEKLQHEHAERTAKLALDSLNEVYRQFAPRRLVVSPPEIDELPAAPAALPPEVVPLLEYLVKTYAEVARAGEGFDSLRSQVAEANYRRGDVEQRLGHFEKAIDAYKAAIDLSRKSLDKNDAEMTIRLARAWNELGRVQRQLKNFDAMEKAHKEAIKLLQDTPKAVSDQPQCRFELAWSYYALNQEDMFQARPGSVGPPGKGPRDDYGPPDRGQGGPPGGKDRDGPPDRRPGPPDRKSGTPVPEEGQPGFGPPDRNAGGPPDRMPGGRGPGGTMNDRSRNMLPAIRILGPLVNEYPSAPEYKHLLALCHRQGPGSRPLDSVTLLRELVDLYPQVPDYRFDLCESLASLVRPSTRKDGDGKGKTRTADDSKLMKSSLSVAITLSDELIRQYPSVPEYKAANARYHDAFGMNLLKLGEVDAAVEQARLAVNRQKEIATGKTVTASYVLWLGMMERSLGDALSAQGDHAEARRLVESGIRRVEGLDSTITKLAGVRQHLAMAHRTLANVLTKLGATAEAEKATKKASEYAVR